MQPPASPRRPAFYGYSLRTQVYKFTKPWSDGTIGITLSPLKLLQKLAALVPLPRVHLVRYGGCSAPLWSRWELSSLSDPI